MNNWSRSFTWMSYSKMTRAISKRSKQDLTESSERDYENAEQDNKLHLNASFEGGKAGENEDKLQQRTGVDSEV